MTCAGDAGPEGGVDGAGRAGGRRRGAGGPSKQPPNKSRQGPAAEAQRALPLPCAAPHLGVSHHAGQVGVAHHLLDELVGRHAQRVKLGLQSGKAEERGQRGGRQARRREPAAQPAEGRAEGGRGLGAPPWAVPRPNARACLGPHPPPNSAKRSTHWLATPREISPHCTHVHLLRRHVHARHHLSHGGAAALRHLLLQHALQLRAVLGVAAARRGRGGAGGG